MAEKFTAGDDPEKIAVEKITAKAVREWKGEVLQQIQDMEALEDASADPVALVDTSLNASLHEFIVSNATNVLSVTKVRQYTRDAVLAAIEQYATRGRVRDSYLNAAIKSQHATPENPGGGAQRAVEYSSMVHYLESSKCEHVYFMDLDQLDGCDSRPELKKAFFAAAPRNSYEEHVGVKVPEHVARTIGFQHSESLGVMLSSADFCTVACRHGLEEIRRGASTCVVAATADSPGTYKKLSIASALTLITATLWDDDEDEEIDRCHIVAPPVFCGNAGHLRPQRPLKIYRQRHVPVPAI